LIMHRISSFQLTLSTETSSPSFGVIGTIPWQRLLCSTLIIIWKVKAWSMQPTA
jgi:hypothetical protein